MLRLLNDMMDRPGKNLETLSSGVALALFLVLGIVLKISGGQYHPAGLYALTLAFVAFCAWLMIAPKGGAMNRRRFAVLLGSITFLFFGMLVDHHEMMYVLRPVVEQWMDGLIIAAYVGLSAFFLCAAYAGRGKGFRWTARGLCFGIAGLLLAAEVLAIVASPRPYIDVWVKNTMGAAFFLQGQNPYSQTYPDIYHHAFGYEPTFAYWPGLLAWIVPALYVFGDIRYAGFVANAAVAVLLLMLGRRLRMDDLGIGLCILAWLAFPVTYFVLEQAWVDTLTTPVFLVAVIAFLDRKWAVAGAAMGFLCTIKQYNLVVALFGLLALAGGADRRAAVRYTLAATLVFVVALVPFLISDFDGWWRSTVSKFIDMPARADALTWPAWFQQNGLGAVPSWTYGAFPLALIAGVGFWVWRRRTLPSLRRLNVGIVVAFGATFLLGKQAFCNYYHLLAFFLIPTLMELQSGTQLPAPGAAGSQEGDRGESAGAGACGS